jgi:hypothetical protein
MRVLLEISLFCVQSMLLFLLVIFHYISLCLNIDQDLVYIDWKNSFTETCVNVFELELCYCCSVVVGGELVISPDIVTIHTNYIVN